MSKADWDAVIEAMTVDAYGYGEELSGFLCGFEDLPLPTRARVVGSEVEVVGYDHGGEIRGLVARVKAGGGASYEVSLFDVEFPADSDHALLADALRHLVGLEPIPRPKSRSKRRASKTKRKKSKRRSEPKAAPLPSLPDLLLGKPVDVVVLASSARLTSLSVVASGERLVTRRALGGEPGEILTVVPTRVYRYARRPCLTFERFENRRIDVPALNLEPLGLSQLGVWDPDQHYWGEKGPVEEWAKQVHAGGARPEFMFEEALPFEPGLFGEGRIRDAVILRENGDLPGSIQVLHQLLECDLRVLDAHAHLGHFSFDIVRFAFTHYRIGYEIGLLSLPGDFNGVLPWACLENRPFLRCMHGFGLCLWRLERWEEAEALFTRMLWFNPTDNLGARFLLGDIRGRVAWKPEEPWT